MPTAPPAAEPGRPTMTLRGLKWAFLISLVSLLLILEYARYLLYPFLASWTGRLIMDAVVVMATLFFFGWMFSVVSRMHERLQRQNRELIALHRAALDIYGELSLDSVLQKVVDQAVQLLDARYGAVAVTDEEGNVREFITSGISPEQRARIGAPPRGDGLLGVVLREGQRLRISDVSRDPRSVGFPPHHPPMRSLLAIPIQCKSPFLGNLYVAEKKGRAPFSREDEETLVRFATSAAIAIDNADVHQHLRILAVAEERVRIAREMHDGMAQVLAYVNTKAQAVQGFMAKGRTAEAASQLQQLAAAAREVYTDVREGILALRTPMKPGAYHEALREYVTRWRQQTGLGAELEVDDGLELAPTVELQLLRIVQEALANVRKHSGADTAWVKCRQIDGRLCIEVRDNGKGFDPEARHRSELPRFGLAIMKERAESIGAELSLESAPGRGTRVRIELPRSSIRPQEREPS